MQKSRQSRVARPARSSLQEVQIPDKLYFRIGEVSRLARTRPYVLRYWETEFPTLRPVKSRTGHRLYRREDVVMVFKIKHLLYEKGFTIEGARKQLAGGVAEPEDRKQASLPMAHESAKLAEIKQGLEGILTMLSRQR